MVQCHRLSEIMQSMLLKIHHLSSEPSNVMRNTNITRTTHTY